MFHDKQTNKDKIVILMLIEAIDGVGEEIMTAEQKHV